jgi:nucleoside transporter
MTFQLRWRLSVMMLLEYAIWGAWTPVLSSYLGDPVSKGGLGFDTAKIGVIYSLLPLASIVTPFIAGQIADRRIATQRLLGVLQILCAGGLFVMASQHSFSGMALWMLIYSLIFAPTLALTNSLAFHHLSNSDKEFGAIRVWGTIGWIISGLLLSFFRSHMPSLTPTGMSDCVLLAAVMAAIMGVFSFTLPHTPPQKNAANPLAFLDALKMLRDRNFAVFMIISFVVSTELQFYYMLTAPFLENAIHIPHDSVSAVMTIAQAAELIVLGLILPTMLPKIGVRRAMVIGILAWPIRYVIFAAGAAMPALKPLVIASLTLHGFCYVFFFVVGFIYVDQVAHKDIRASAQSLIALVVLGAGSYVGSLFAGWIGSICTNPVTKATNWTELFLIPCALTVICAVIFPLLFRDSTPASKEAVDEEPLTAV